MKQVKVRQVLCFSFLTEFWHHHVLSCPSFSVCCFGRRVKGENSRHTEHHLPVKLQTSLFFFKDVKGKKDRCKVVTAEQVCCSSLSVARGCWVLHFCNIIIILLSVFILHEREKLFSVWSSLIFCCCYLQRRSLVVSSCSFLIASHHQRQERRPEEKTWFLLAFSKVGLRTTLGVSDLRCIIADLSSEKSLSC